MSINTLMDDLDALANEAVYDSGAVRSCPVHEDLYILNPDAERKAYAYMTNKLKSKWGGLEWREEGMEAVKEILDWAAEDECPSCARNRTL